MAFDPTCVATLPMDQFRRFGIACCYRLGCHLEDKRLAKALKTLERSLGPPLDEKLRRDALNAARSVRVDPSMRGGVRSALVSAVVCASWSEPNPNLIGNFEHALERGEGLGRDEVREIERELLEAILNR